MIKLLKKYQIRSTPFDAAKNWALSNVENNDLWLMEDTGSEVPVALQFLDYGDGSSTPFENSSCNIALEQQTDDRAIIREGQKTTGPFYADQDPTNPDGTYKRTIYSQVHTMFYNDYRNPTQMWGLENIDFDLSETKKMLTNKFRLISIPRLVYGDKIIPLSVELTDPTLDNLYTIIDDGNGNLFAEKNLFSKFQTLGEYSNHFATGSNSDCDYYWNPSHLILRSSSDDGTVDVNLISGSITDFVFSESFAFISTSLESGDISESPFTESGLFDIALTSGSVFEAIITYSVFDSSSAINVALLYGNIGSSSYEEILGTLDVGIESGSLRTVLITASSPSMASSFEVGFYTGSVISVILSQSAPPETASFGWGFYSGSIYNTIVSASMSMQEWGVDSGFYSGSLTTWITQSQKQDSGSFDTGLYSGSVETLTASFSAITPTFGPAPLSVTFSNDSTAGRFNSFTWVWGDKTANGVIGTYANMSHSYAIAGTYDVSLRAVSASYSHSFTRSAYIVVS